MAAAGRHFDIAETLEEAEVIATARACSEGMRQEAEATARTEELRRQLQQITRP
jgi:3-dehydroquinate dehydratase